MARALPEWIGQTDDQRAPPRVRQRVFDREKGTCHLCKTKIQPGQKWDMDHAIALINGGENSEANLKPAHRKCHIDKTAQDVAEKAKIAAIRQRHHGIVDAPKMPSAPFPKTLKSARRERVAAGKLPLPDRKRAMFEPNNPTGEVL